MRTSALTPPGVSRWACNFEAAACSLLKYRAGFDSESDPPLRLSSRSRAQHVSAFTDGGAVGAVAHRHASAAGALLRQTL